MQRLLTCSFFALIALASAQEDLNVVVPSVLDEQITQCESERARLRREILESKYFSRFMSDRSGDEVEALLYSVGNFLTSGTHRVSANESDLQQEGRKIASQNSTDEGRTIEALKAFVENRNVLNSLYAQRSRARYRTPRFDGWGQSQN